MAKVSCFYNCGASGLTLENIDQHYQKFHQKLKAFYWKEGFACDNCYRWQENSLLYSPVQNQTQLDQKPHYCGKCVNQFQSQPAQSSLKPKTMNKRNLSPNKKKTLKSKLKPKKSLKKKTLKKTKPTTALTLKPTSKSIKNPLQYYECMKSCCLKGQKISQTARECKTNALAINSRMSASKKKAVQKIRTGYRQMGVGLAEFIKANK